MSTSDFLTLYLTTLVTMLACRCIPMFVLKGRDLPEKVSEALGLIPPAAFAALVANDLFSTTMFSNGVWAGLMPLVASLVVVVVARKTKSLIWCVIAGVGCYVLLTLI